MHSAAHLKNHHRITTRDRDWLRTPIGIQRQILADHQRPTCCLCQRNRTGTTHLELDRIAISRIRDGITR